MSTSLLKEQLELSWKADVSDDVNKEVFDQDDSISSGDLADIQDLTNEQLAETKDQLFQCEKDLEKLEEESARKIKLLRDDIERYQQERDEECSKYDALNQTHIELKLNYENQINENKSLRSEIDAEIELRQKLQIQYDTLQDQKANSAMAFDESKYIVEAKYLKTQVEELKKELSDLRDRNSVLRDDNYVLKTQNENYIMKSNELNFELEEIIKHRGDLTAQNVQMSDDLRISLKKCIGLQEEVDHLSASYELLTGEYDNKMKLYNDLLDEMKNIQMMNDNLKLALEEANTDVNSLKDELHITKQLTNELQSNKEEWLSHEEKLFYQEMQDAEEKIAHLTKEYSDIVESLESQKIGYEEKLNDKSKQIQDFQSVIDRQRGEYEHSINLHEKEMKSALKMVEDLEVELKECKATIQHHEDDERARRNELLKEISRLKSKSVEDCNRVLITLTGLQQVIRQMCTESMANRDSLKVLYAEHVQTRNMMKKLDVCHQLVIPSNTMDYSESSSPVTGGNKDIDCTRYDRKLFASNQVELGQHPILQYGDLMSRLLRAFLKKMDQHDADRKELNKMLDGVKSTLLEEQHQYRLLSRTNDASMIEVSVVVFCTISYCLHNMSCCLLIYAL